MVNNGNNYKKIEEQSREELVQVVKSLKKRKKFGLVWEDKPENVVEQCKYEFPVLEEVKARAINKIIDKPTNLIIEGDNYHSLSVLNYTHAGKIDVIYIDPPYNTGAKTWRYNNDYVDADDAFRHSKWISFMRHRLKIAKNLLTERGFLICAIDANELFSVGLLLDELFEEHNRVGLVTVLHNPKGRNFTKWFSANSEYMLVYAKNASAAAFNDVAIDDEVKNSFNLTDKKGKRYRLEPLMRSRTETLRKNKPAFWYPIYVSKDLKEVTRKKKRGYYVVYPIASNGKEATWINLPETFDEKNENGTFIAKKERGRIYIYRKFYEQQIFKNVWVDQKYQSEFHGTNLLKKLLGKNIFEYPKSLYLIEDILKITTKTTSIILDFFAGSGTTGHAVLRLNRDDGGTRQFILCTNNENDIAEDVTYPRIKKAINGVRGLPKITGFKENVRYFRTAFLQKDKVSDDTRRKLVTRSTEMICVREDTFIKNVDNPRYKIYTNGKTNTGILFDLDSITDFKKKIDAFDLPARIYVFSLTNDTYADDFADLKTEHKLRPIPESILEVYRKIFT